MITSKKLSIALLIFAFCYAGAAHGMSAKEKIAHIKNEQKNDRDYFVAFITLNQKFEIVASGGPEENHFKDCFLGLDGKRNGFSREDHIEKLKEAASQAEKEGKPVKFTLEDHSFDHRIKVFALKGKNKIHYAINYARYPHYDICEDGSVLK